ncbi:MAG: CPBP family intramembrane metalloprotease [Chloroflexi bacterium]|nr:CPBP family intramembrane metalloprotease [Chloroflexota bacterium]
MLIGFLAAILFVILGAFSLFVAGAFPLTPNSIQADPVTTVILLVSGGLTLLSGLLFVVGLAIYVVVPSLSPETARKDYAGYPTVLACFFLAIVISVVLQGIYKIAELIIARPTAQALIDESLSPNALIAAIVSTEISLLLVLWIRIVRPGVITWKDMGLLAERLEWKILIGVATGIAVLVSAGVVELLLAQAGIEQTQVRQFAAVREASPIQFGAILLAGAVLVGFVEEAFFRGYAFNAFLNQKGPVQAYLLSAVIFALAHLDWRAFLPLLVTGLILAHVFRVTRSIVPAIVAHAMNNSVAFTALYLGLI